MPVRASEYKGKVGTIGDIGCLVFSNKNINTGEGGMLITNNEEMAKARLLRSMDDHYVLSTSSRSRNIYDILELGYNYRMDDIRASIGIVQMKKLSTGFGETYHVHKRYIELFQKLKARRAFAYNMNSFQIIFADVTKIDFWKRDRIRKLHAAGIQQVCIITIHKFSIYSKYKATLPRTEYITDSLITLPCMVLTNDEIDFIVETLNKALNG